MKRAVRISVIAIMALTAAGAARAQNRIALPLREAEQQALKNHPQIQAAGYLAQAAAEAVRETRSAFLPTVLASITAADSASGTRIAAGGLNNPLILERFASGVSVGQLVTDFGRTRALANSMDLRASTQRETVNVRRADVLLQVDRAYFAALRAQAVDRVAEETERARQLVADAVAAQAASGLKSGLDVSFAKVSLSEAQILVLQASNDVAAALATLNASMGSSAGGPYNLIDEPLPAPPPAAADALVAEALRNRPDLAAQRFSREAALGFAEAERDLRMPVVSVVAAFGLIPYYQVGLTTSYAAAGVNLTVPVMTGGLFAARRAEAELKADAEEQQVRELELTITHDVTVAWLDAQAAFRRLDLADQLRAAATDAADLAQARYDMGLGSIIELTQAQLNKTRAEIEAATARYEYQIRSVALRYQTGDLR
jgi:outer membrane protein